METNKENSVIIFHVNIKCVLCNKHIFCTHDKVITNDEHGES